MSAFDYYQTLLKPSWAPPAEIFGPVWSVLYILIAISFGFVFYKVAAKKLPAGTAVPFVLNLIFNLAFTPTQFGLKNNLLAALDVLLVLATLIWAMIVIWPKIKWIAIANLPYLLWVIFATVLQITVTVMNR